MALPREALFALVRKLIEAERVPFEAEPLTGVQVLGILETRLLSFRRVIVLDAGEHVLPGTPQGDPLLPDSLRPALGLPERRTAEIPAAHHFFSLIHGAEEALILWREGGDAGGLFDGKKIKSRFVEELLWEEEKKLGRLLAATGDDGPLRVLADTPAPVMAAPRAIPVTPAIRALMDNLLRRPVSASLLDAYLFCPVRFFHERILKMREADAPSEEYDPPAVGVLLHKTLEAFYRERLHTPLPAGADMPESEFEALREIFLQRPELAALDRLWPADALSMLRVSGPTRLQRYLRRQPACTPLLLEQSFSAPLRVGRDITLTGTVDRLDLRDDGAVILDYKTGKIPRILQSVWGDEAFWDGLDGFGPEDPLLPGFIAQAFPSVQLPLYLYLMGMASGLPEPTQAAWVELAAAGDEAPLFGKTVTEEQRDRAVNEQIPQLVGMTLQSLAETGEFRPHPGPHCRWCSCRSACMLPVAE